MPLRYVNSPVGLLRLSGTDAALHEVRLVGEPGPEEDPVALSLGEQELKAYFAGTLREFTVPTQPLGTEFQRTVWAALKTIPYGEVRTYGQGAAMIAKPKAARAVGQAVGANPCLILIPCHRVVAANGIGGFSSGLEVKRQLLALENPTYSAAHPPLRM